MNIKQAEEASGIQKSNLRFYEKEGLVVPKRNKENDYGKDFKNHMKVRRFSCIINL